MSGYALVLPKVVVVEFTLLRQDMPQELLDAQYVDTEGYRTYSFPGISFIPLAVFKFMSLLDELGREYRWLDLSDPIPEGN